MCNVVNCSMHLVDPCITCCMCGNSTYRFSAHQ